MAKTTGDDCLHLRVSIARAPSIRRKVRSARINHKLTETNSDEPSYSTIKPYRVQIYMGNRLHDMQSNDRVGMRRSIYTHGRGMEREEFVWLKPFEEEIGEAFGGRGP